MSLLSLDQSDLGDLFNRGQNYLGPPRPITDRTTGPPMPSPSLPAPAAAPVDSTSTANFNPAPYTGPTSVDFSNLPNAPQFNFPDFVAPTGVTEMNDPGYQFRLGQGEAALQGSAAANGVLNSGGTLQGILNYGQNYASNEYQNVYNRAIQNYNANLGTQEQRFAPQLAQYQNQNAALTQGDLAAFNQAFQNYQFGVNASLAAENLVSQPPAQ